jgi:hypothetical protein
MYKEAQEKKSVKIHISEHCTSGEHGCAYNTASATGGHSICKTQCGLAKNDAHNQRFSSPLERQYPSLLDIVL